MAIMTKALTAKLAKLEAEKEKITESVYAVVAPRNDIPFDQCYEKASGGLRQAYHVAVKNIEEFRYEMISQGRAYYSTMGSFITNFR